MIWKNNLVGLYQNVQRSLMSGNRFEIWCTKEFKIKSISKKVRLTWNVKFSVKNVLCCMPIMELIQQLTTRKSVIGIRR